MKESTWEDCIESTSSIKISSDRAKTRSLIDTALGRISYLKENKIREKNANYIFEGHYSSVLELLRACILSVLKMPLKNVKIWLMNLTDY